MGDLLGRGRLPQRGGDAQLLKPRAHLYNLAHHHVADIIFLGGQGRTGSAGAKEGQARTQRDCAHGHSTIPVKSASRTVSAMVLI